MADNRQTRALFRRIAVVFDFDDTLAPDSTSSFVESCGIDSKRFWSERVHPRIRAGWDPIPAALYSLIEVSRSRPRPDDRITRERLAAFGRDLELFEGVPDLFDRIRWTAHQVDPTIEVEYYLVSCGLAEIIRHTRVAPAFRALWANEFEYSDTGEIHFPKQIISHTEKTRYLFRIAKGIETESDVGRPFAVNQEIPPDRLHVPISQMIYVGDGFTDVPCFSLLNQEKGVAIGVYKQHTKEKWGEQSGVGKGQRVSNLARADYREGSELVRSLTVGVKSICYQIQLREQSIGE